MILGIILFLFILEAVHEGIKQRKLHMIAGIIEAVKLIGMVVLIPFLIFWDSPLDSYFMYDGPVLAFWTDFIPSYIIGVVTVRFGIFDYVYNIAAGNKLGYVGNTKWIDMKIMQKVNKFSGPLFFGWFRLIAFILGVSLLLQL